MRVDDALTTRHSLPPDHLGLGATYYAGVSSRNMAGVDTAPPVPFLTGGGKRNTRVGAKTQVVGLGRRDE